MIDTYVNDDKDSDVNLQYPILMKNRANKMIVFFINLNTGILLSKGSSETKDELGTLHTNWVPANDTEHWIKFNGSIEIANS